MTPQEMDLRRSLAEALRHLQNALVHVTDVDTWQELRDLSRRTEALMIKSR